MNTVRERIGSGRPWKILGFILFAGAILAVILTRVRFDSEILPESEDEYTASPVYDSYEFIAGDSMVDIGIQPLWVPASMIAETMKRDCVLRDALSDKGMKIRFHSFLKGSDVNAFLETGDLECGMGGDMPALVASAKLGAFVTSLVQYGFCSIVAKRYMLLEELRGKRIGYAHGSNAHHELLECLDSVDLRETDVHMIALDVHEMPEALDRGDIDAFTAWEPTPTIALTRFKDAVVIHRCLTTGYLYFSESFYNRHPGAVRQIVASQIRALAWLRAGEQNLRTAGEWAQREGAKLSGQNSCLTVDQYVELAREDLLGIPVAIAAPSGDLDVTGRLRGELEFLKELGKIPASSDWEALRWRFNTTILNEVLSERKRYRLDITDFRPIDQQSGHHEL